MKLKTKRRNRRQKSRIAIIAQGVASSGKAFNETAEIVDRGSGGLGLSLDTEPKLASRLEVYIPHDGQLFHFCTEVRHVSSATRKRIVGVEFRSAQLPEY